MFSVVFAILRCEMALKERNENEIKEKQKLLKVNASS